MLAASRTFVSVVAVLALVGGACSDDDGENVRTLDDGGSGSASASVPAGGSASGPAPASGPASGSSVSECEAIGQLDSADTTVAVTLDEWTIALDGEAGAGLVRFDAANAGAEPHEVVILAGVEPSDLPVDDAGALVEGELPEGALVGEIEAFPAGTDCSGAFELAAGTYTLLCNVVEVEPSGDVESHLAEGMITTTTVS